MEHLNNEGLLTSEALASLEQIYLLYEALKTNNGSPIELTFTSTHGGGYIKVSDRPFLQWHSFKDAHERIETLRERLNKIGR